MGQEAQSTTQWTGRRVGLPPACAAASEGRPARATARNNSAHATEVGVQTSRAAQSTHRGGANLTPQRPASTCKVMPWLIYLPHSPHANVLSQRHAHYMYENSHHTPTPNVPPPSVVSQDPTLLLAGRHHSLSPPFGRSCKQSIWCCAIDCWLVHDICLNIFAIGMLVENQACWSLAKPEPGGHTVGCCSLLPGVFCRSRAETTKSTMICGPRARTCTSPPCCSLRQPDVTLQGSPDGSVQGSLDRVFGALKRMSSASIPTFWGWLLLEPVVAVV